MINNQTEDTMKMIHNQIEDNKKMIHIQTEDTKKMTHNQTEDNKKIIFNQTEIERTILLTDYLTHQGTGKLRKPLEVWRAPLDQVPTKSITQTKQVYNVFPVAVCLIQMPNVMNSAQPTYP